MQVRLHQLQPKIQSEFDGFTVAVLPPVLFILEDGPPGGFKEGDNMVSGKTPNVMVFSESGPSAMVAVTGTKGFFQAVLVSRP